jgi:hypothetical protein
VRQRLRSDHGGSGARLGLADRRLGLLEQGEGGRVERQPGLEPRLRHQRPGRQQVGAGDRQRRQQQQQARQPVETARGTAGGCGRHPWTWRQRRRHGRRLLRPVGPRDLVGHAFIRQGGKLHGSAGAPDSRAGPSVRKPGAGDSRRDKTRRSGRRRTRMAAPVTRAERRAQRIVGAGFRLPACRGRAAQRASLARSAGAWGRTCIGMSAGRSQSKVTIPAATSRS